MSRETAWDDINTWTDKEISDYLGIEVDEVDYNARKEAVEKWIEENAGVEESIKWYSKGKFSEVEETDDEPDEQIEKFKVDDRVRCGSTFYWYDDVTHREELTSVNNKGNWVASGISGGRITRISYCENIDGYTGQIIQIQHHWPWYQITNFEKQ